MIAIQTARFEAVLAHHAERTAKYPQYAGRYAASLWQIGVLKKAFNAGKQGVTLPVGTVVAFQRREGSGIPGLNHSHVVILHESLMCETSLGNHVSLYL